MALSIFLLFVIFLRFESTQNAGMPVNDNQHDVLYRSKFLSLAENNFIASKLIHTLNDHHVAIIIMQINIKQY